MSLRHSQNFLRRASLVERLLTQTTIDSRDTVLDIGAGRGRLTAVLASRAASVIAIEPDPRLATLLAQRFATHAHVQIQPRTFAEAALPRHPFKVFANIPFDHTAEIIRRLTGPHSQLTDAYLVVQRAAADRFLGQPRATLAACLLHPWFEATILHTFSRHDFEPAPRVDTVLLRLAKRGPPLVSPNRADAYRDFVSAAFTLTNGALETLLRLALTRAEITALTRANPSGRAEPSLIPAATWLALFLRSSPALLHGRVSGAARRVARHNRGLVKRTRTRDWRLGKLRAEVAADDCRPPPRRTASHPARSQWQVRR